MKMLLRHSGARVDIVASMNWYEQKATGVSSQFLTAIEDAYVKIRENPQRWPIRIKDARYCRLNRFPFRVIFVERPDAIWIIAVAHDSRRPSYWSKRLKDIPGA